jgi:hypothetical protein
MRIPPSLGTKGQDVRKTLQLTADSLAARQKQEAKQAEIEQRLDAQAKQDAAWGRLLKVCDLKHPDADTGRAIVDVAAMLREGNCRTILGQCSELREDREPDGYERGEAYVASLLLQAWDGSDDLVGLGRTLKAFPEGASILLTGETRLQEAIVSQMKMVAAKAVSRQVSVVPEQEQSKGVPDKNVDAGGNVYSAEQSTPNEMGQDRDEGEGSEILDQLAEEAAQEQRSREERREWEKQRRISDEAYLAAWDRLKQFASAETLKGKSSDEYFVEAEAAFQAVAAALVGRDWAKYLPEVTRTIERPNRPFHDARYTWGERIVAELLRLALVKTTRVGKIAREWRRATEREPRFCGLIAEIDNVEFAILQRHLNGRTSNAADGLQTPSVPQTESVVETPSPADDNNRPALRQAAKEEQREGNVAEAPRQATNREDSQQSVTTAHELPAAEGGPAQPPKSKERDVGGRWYHLPEEKRDDRFSYGPVKGTGQDIDAALRGRSRRDTHFRLLKGMARRNEIWVIRREKTCYEVYFSTPEGWSKVKSWLERLTRSC